MRKSALGLIGLLLFASTALAADDKTPDALAVTWQGKPPCEKLFEDAQIRVLRCTFPPGAKHVRHTHPAYLAYVLSGGKGEISDASGKRAAVSQTDQFLNSAPVPWHEFSNVGDTTIRYLIIERKYTSPGK